MSYFVGWTIVGFGCCGQTISTWAGACGGSGAGGAIIIGIVPCGICCCGGGGCTCT